MKTRLESIWRIITILTNFIAWNVNMERKKLVSLKNWRFYQAMETSTCTNFDLNCRSMLPEFEFNSAIVILRIIFTYRGVTKASERLSSLGSANILQTRGNDWESSVSAIFTLQISKWFRFDGWEVFLKFLK